MTEEILELAMALGQVGEEDRQRLEQLCALAEQELAGCLKSGITAQDCAAAFVPAAAWTALADWKTGESMGGVSSFSAGDITIRRDGAASQEADALRRRGELVLAPYLADRGFSFWGVQG